MNMYIDPKPLQAIRYGKDDYLRANKFAWWILADNNYEWMEHKDTLEVEEAYQSNNQ